MSLSRQRGAPIPVFASDRNAAVYAHYVIARQGRSMPRRQDVDRMFGCFDFPGLDDRQLMSKLSRLDWSTSVEVEVSKWLLITNLAVPLDGAEVVEAS